MKELNRNVLNLTLSLLIVLAMTAFIITQISGAEAFAIEEDVDGVPAGEEIVATEELVEEEPVVIPNDLAEPEELLDEYIEVITKSMQRRMMQFHLRQKTVLSQTN